MKNWIIIILALSLIGLNSCKKDDESSNSEVAVKIGAIAPDFTMIDLDGNAQKLSDYRGQYVVVDFWAAWCGICRTENPKMQALYSAYKTENIAFIGACLDDTDKWEAAVSEDALTFIQLHDAAAFNSEVAQTYGIKSVPFMMLLDETGKILTFTSRVAEIEDRLQSEF